MSGQSVMRRLKRKAMKEQGMSFKDRLAEAIRTGKPVRNVEFNFAGKKLIKA